MSGFLLDTNVLSELVKSKPHAHVVRWVDQADEESLFLSVLTLGEIRKGIALLPQASKRGRLESWLERDLRDRFADRILLISDRIADRWGLLAATAVDHNLTLVTRNARDVEITGVPVLNPWD